MSQASWPFQMSWETHDILNRWEELKEDLSPQRKFCFALCGPENRSTVQVWEITLFLTSGKISDIDTWVSMSKISII